MTRPEVGDERPDSRLHRAGGRPLRRGAERRFDEQSTRWVAPTLR